MNLKNYLSHNFNTTRLEIDGLSFVVWKNFLSTDNESNEKKTIIFNYGLLCTFEHYKFQIKFFHEQGYQIVLMDYRGHHPDNTVVNYDEITFDSISNDYIELMNLLKLKSASFVCHSMGVNVGLEICLKRPDLVDALVLISGSVFPPQNVMFNSNIINILQPYIEGLYHKFPRSFDFVWKKQVHFELVKRFVHISGFNAKKVSKEFIEIYLTKLVGYSPKLFFHLLNSMRDHNILGRIHEIKKPTLIISGDSDNIIPLHLQNILHENIEKSELYIVKDGNHVPQVDDPALVSERMQRFYIKHLFS